MKRAVSALFAFLLLAGGSGCHCFYRCPLFNRCCMDDCAMDGCAMDGCMMDDCGGGCGGCGACGCDAGPYGGCGGMGCSRKLHIFNWSRCCDCCDQCGHWTGEGFESQTGGFYPGQTYGPASADYDQPAQYDEPSASPIPASEPAPSELEPAGPSARSVPGKMRITARDADSATDEIVEEPSTTKRPRPIPPAPRRAKRINSTHTK